MQLLHRGRAAGWKMGSMDGGIGSRTAGMGPSPCPAGGRGGEGGEKITAAAKQVPNWLNPHPKGNGATQALLPLRNRLNSH